MVDGQNQANWSPETGETKSALSEDDTVLMKVRIAIGSAMDELRAVQERAGRSDLGRRVSIAITDMEKVCAWLSWTLLPEGGDTPGVGDRGLSRRKP